MIFRPTVLAALALACALAGSGFAATTSQSTPYGSFALIEEARTGEAPIMHVATEWTKLHLRWRSADSRMMIELIDDGYIMEVDIDGYECGSRMAYLVYEKKPGEPKMWRALRSSLRQLIDACPRVPAPMRSAYRAEFERSVADYRLAVEAMKQRASLLFRGRMTRCLPPRVPGIPSYGEPACDKVK